MSLRDWLDLLFIPVFIAIGAAALGGLQACAQIQAEEQRSQQAAVHAYLNQMERMLLNEDRKLRKSKEGDLVQTLAQSRTLSVLDGLADQGTGPRHKRTIIRFLYENSLIDRNNPIIRLNEADLKGADLNYMELSGAYLPFVYLNRANLDHAILEDAELAGAHLQDAYLSGANLTNAHLKDAHLNDAELSGAGLDSTSLVNADLSGAHLENTNLSGAYLKDATLGGTSLPVGRGGAFVLASIGVTDSALLQQTRAFGLATMPDETVHDGHYVTDEFATLEGLGATLSFEVGEGWERDVDMSSSGELYLNGPGEGLLIFTSPTHAYDRGNMSEAKEAPARNKDVKGWRSWFWKHPNLTTTKPPVLMSVGGKQGETIDVTPISGLKSYPRDTCAGEGVPCVPLYKGSDDESALQVYDGWTDRLVILDVEGETVIIDISAPANEMNEFFLKAKEVLDTVEWRSP